MVPIAVGIDLGATTIKGSGVGPDGELLDEPTVVGTRAQEGPGAVLDRVAAMVHDLANRFDARAVGIASCGMIDPHRGHVIEATETMVGWEGTEIADGITGRTGVPCACDNDGNAAALAEAAFGAGRGAHGVVVITLGTGVGGGVVIGGRIHHGAGFMAGHLGHIKVATPGERCACGAHGCLEAYASAFALRRASGADAVDVFRQARRGDAAAVELVRRAAEALGTACADIAHVLNPDVIAVGGGIAASWDLLEPGALARYRQLALPSAFRSTRLVRAELAHPGIVGAAMLTWNHAATG